MEAQPNTKLADVMRRVDCSNKGLAVRVNSVAKRHGITLKTDHVLVKKWLDGAQPRPRTARFVALALTEKAGCLITLDDIGMQPRTGTTNFDTALIYPADSKEAQATLEALVQFDVGNSDTISTAPIVPSAWSAPLISWLLSRSTGVAPKSSGTRRIGLPEVEAVCETIKMFMQLDFQFGGGHARIPLTHYFAHDVLPMLDGAYSETVGRRLFSAAAEVAQLLGWTAYDLDRHGLAQRYLIQALHLAQSGEDRVMGGRILSNMSHQSTYLGRYREAAQLARAAQEGAKGVASGTVMALFLAMEARAEAASGDGRACSTALREAEASFSRRRASDDPPWIRYFDESELAGEASHCFRDLRQPYVAQEFINRAVALTDPTYVRTLAFIRLVHAASRLHTDEHQRADPDEAASIAINAVTQPGILKSQRYLRYIRDLCAEFSPYRSVRAVKQFMALVGSSYPEVLVD